ncbi:MAG: endopeptidase La [Myxococcota bacterium]|nr:endopeptidase La [Myxococcota bacterium]
MPTLLPTLPIHETVLLPGMIARLHIMRPSETAAVELHLSSGRPLLALPLQIPELEQPLPENFHEVGCTARVLKAVRLGDGTIRVLLEGLQRAQGNGIRLDPTGGYTASVRLLSPVVQDEDFVANRTEQLRQHLAALIAKDTGLPPALQKLATLDVAPGRLADQIISNLVIPRFERLALLAERVVDVRVDAVLLLLAREEGFREMESELSKRVQSTMDKQQRDYYLRERIRVMRQELGELPADKDEAALMEEKLRETGMPEEALEEALRELNRMRRMHPDAAEYNVARTWLEWLSSMPWTARSEDNATLQEAAAVLSEDHYGLEKVKDRILEYLAVRKLKPDGQGPVLCLLGPPGVGKTSLGRSVARALGRSFQRVSLGGVKDEAEIRGHRRTYVGALPGRLVHALKRAGTRNPVIILDEIDKLGKDFRGDPSAALLEVLDPEQNSAFVDHYLDVSLDLSEVLFICTANVGSTIPPALHDRLEIIDIAGYTLEEKLQIAKRHLIPRMLTSHGLTQSQLSISGPAVQHLIESYTREAGVRSLERQIASINRKAARKIVEGRKRAMRIDSAPKVTTLLGPPRHFIELVERMDIPGVAVGLAWTPSGGDIMFIEATLFADTAGLKLTGQLGDVMKESAQIALSLIRTRADTLGIEGKQFKENAIHLHVPAGAIPKDGPSAGITMAVALISLLTGKRVRSNLALTGELTLRGKVMPVGGIKEKILAARRAGVKTVILPRHNAVDLDDIPEVLRRDLTYHFVDSIDEVLPLALEAVDVNAESLDSGPQIAQ